MKRTMSICLSAIFVLICMVCIVGLIRLYRSEEEDTQPERTQIAIETETAEPQELTESMIIHKPYAYLIREKDGFLAVYGADGITFLFETNIRTSSLDESLKEKAAAGIRIANEEELYDFLESYSS